MFSDDIFPLPFSVVSTGDVQHSVTFFDLFPIFIFGPGAGRVRGQRDFADVGLYGGLGVGPRHISSLSKMLNTRGRL